MPQGPTQSMMEHLTTKYQVELATMASVAKQAAVLGPLAGFAEWCENYLAATNSPRATWYPPAGVGVILADGTRITLQRQRADFVADGGGTGQMQASGAIGITTGEGLGEGTLPK